MRFPMNAIVVRLFSLFVLIPGLVAGLAPSWAVLLAALACLIIARQYATLPEVEHDDVGLNGRCVPPFVALLVIIIVSAVRAAFYLLS